MRQLCASRPPFPWAEINDSGRTPTGQTVPPCQRLKNVFQPAHLQRPIPLRRLGSTGDRPRPPRRLSRPSRQYRLRAGGCRTTETLTGAVSRRVSSCAVAASGSGESTAGRLVARLASAARSMAQRAAAVRSRTAKRAVLNHMDPGITPFSRCSGKRKPQQKSVAFCWKPGSVQVDWGGTNRYFREPVQTSKWSLAVPEAFPVTLTRVRLPAVSGRS